ncbi:MULTISPECIES: hypothetical protein [unclassified Sphingopyxis]|nr:MULTISPECIES: hypothetical protein [unclassified Sphingopyxis]
MPPDRTAIRFDLPAIAKIVLGPCWRAGPLSIMGRTPIAAG